MVIVLLGFYGTKKSKDVQPLYWEFYEKGGWRAARFGKWKAIQKNSTIVTKVPLNCMICIEIPLRL